MASRTGGNVRTAIKACAQRLSYREAKKEQQEAIIKFVVEGQDVFVCLPTGFGKSMCFLCIPVLVDIITGKSSAWSVIVIVSPLVALMNDQVTTLNKKGLNAVSIVADNTHHSGDDQSAVVRGDFQYIFTTPEILLCSKDWINVFQSPSFVERLVGVIIDEAHCVKKWGSDFRKEYSKLGELRGFFPPKVHIMALTATASAASRKEIIKVLGMLKPHMIIRCPNKPNIKLVVEEMRDDGLDEVMKPLVEELKRKRTDMDKTIIFCRSYKDCASLYFYCKDELKDSFTDPPGYPNVSKFRMVDMFSACNSSVIKNQIVASFSSPNSRLRIVIATVAFGMGIDCPNIRQVIHWSPPSDIEAYIQEIGRAGRDGKMAYATLLYSKKNISLPFMDSSMVVYCRNNNTCRRDLLFRDFDYTRDEDITGCNCCDLCTMICECSHCSIFD
ncbi:PREDICTED: ATP-dependent DNA helicase Q-like SIM [Amphimedon queenslandica]|uniref:DNA 3'-5' helicase n=1 Tax=Amphimedon queenslandica TaxID=400682 RepID=A0AAN0IJQ8_AMPQE|nr:PREDICTED: ATP-dependent DNA helicase Q-like SIM [Amphimedon queenslandica]|eukprot:XP_003391641.1 PREDICTED: ATP-dependent DNA helicase Q-like SIM [Amphimedon queenslandica]